jgi:hypothetical protein
MAVILAVAAALAGATPAAAHACAAPVEIGVGEPVNVTIGVTAEGEPVTAVDVEVPEDFTVLDTSTAAWEAERDGSTVHYTGGRVEPFSCAYLSIEGTAEEKGRLVFPIILHTEDGDSVRHDSTELGAERSAQLVFAGVSAFGDGDGGSVSPIGFLGVGLVVVGLFVAVVHALRWAGVIGGRGRPLVGRPQPAPPRAGRGPAPRGSGSSRPRIRKRALPRRR